MLAGGLPTTDPDEILLGARSAVSQDQKDQVVCDGQRIRRRIDPSTDQGRSAIQFDEPGARKKTETNLQTAREIKDFPDRKMRGIFRVSEKESERIR